MSREIRLYQSIAAAIRQGSEIPVKFYDSPSDGNWAKEIHSVNSTNHGCLGNLANYLNLINGHLVVSNGFTIANNWLKFLTGPFMDREQFTRSVYLEWIFDSVLSIRELTKGRNAAWTNRNVQGDLLGVITSDQIHDAARRWCDAMSAFMIFMGSYTGPKSLWPGAHLVKGPALIKAEGPVKEVRTHGFPIGMAGRRAVAKRDDGEWRHLVPSTAMDILRNIEDSDRSTTLIQEALKAKSLNHSRATSFNPKPYCDNRNRGAHKDLFIYVSWCKVLHPYSILVAKDWSCSVLHSAPESSTTSIYAGLALNNGSQYFLLADPGGRDSGSNDNDIKRGTCVLTHNMYTGIVATAQRDDKSLRESRMTLPASEVLYHIMLSPHESMQVLWPLNNNPETQPPPKEPPANEEPKKISWLQKLIALLRKVQL